LQNAPGSKNIQIQEKPIDIRDDGKNEAYYSSGDDERDVQAEDSDWVKINPTLIADRCRSLSTIEGTLQGLVRCA